MQQIEQIYSLFYILYSIFYNLYSLLFTLYSILYTLFLTLHPDILIFIRMLFELRVYVRTKRQNF
ncbi:hypothetical protein D0817_15690 [Flavobacterium cupreum]|uniref:Uncharacterized protein n=1 Tax=Flavobacterium cupreum TaxID=2133766 RepID=A0A434A5F7_9FLAO|nr:hypothetical protein D0817_15690 [Flavobacterium cupreum]